MAKGFEFIDKFIERYTSGAFNNDWRKDDSFQFRQTRLNNTEIDCRDIAYPGMDKRYADVVNKSPLHLFMEHKKGSHGRGTGMTLMR